MPIYCSSSWRSRRRIRLRILRIFSIIGIIKEHRGYGILELFNPI
jgi:hypothetical protein